MELLRTARVTDNISQTRRFFSLSLEDKMTAKHPPEANPNRGYSFVGQESISSISGYDKGLSQGTSVRDIKVPRFSTFSKLFIDQK
jgi:hypothetical protein